MSNETRADILADMRKFVDDTCSNPQCETMKFDAPEIACRVEAWACRIEAAAKRETGNAAELREAMSDACYAMFNFLKTQGGGYEEMATALDKAKAALAAPPRNCDRFATVDEAKAEWLRTNAKLLSSTGLMPFESWLFAKAKGGAK